MSANILLFHWIPYSTIGNREGLRCKCSVWVIHVSREIVWPTHFLATSVSSVRATLSRISRKCFETKKKNLIVTRSLARRNAQHSQIQLITLCGITHYRLPLLTATCAFLLSWKSKRNVSPTQKRNLIGSPSFFAICWHPWSKISLKMDGSNGTISF